MPLPMNRRYKVQVGGPAPCNLQPATVHGRWAGPEGTRNSPRSRAFAPQSQVPSRPTRGGRAPWNPGNEAHFHQPPAGGAPGPPDPGREAVPGSAGTLPLSRSRVRLSAQTCRAGQGRASGSGRGRPRPRHQDPKVRRVVLNRLPGPGRAQDPDKTRAWPGRIRAGVRPAGPFRARSSPRSRPATTRRRPAWLVPASGPAREPRQRGPASRPDRGGDADRAIPGSRRAGGQGPATCRTEIPAASWEAPLAPQPGSVAMNRGESPSPAPAVAGAPSPIRRERAGVRAGSWEGVGASDQGAAEGAVAPSQRSSAAAIA